MKRAVPLAVLLLACASPQPSHTIAPAQSSSATADAHWPDASVARAPDQTLAMIHAVAEAWRANHQNECPTMQRLKDEREVASSTSTTDAWGTPYKIVCDDEETRVISYGPDRREGTADDIVFPVKGVTP